MKPVANDCVTKLINDPISFAMVMDDDRIEDVIVKFVSVLNKRKRQRGGHVQVQVQMGLYGAVTKDDTTGAYPGRSYDSEVVLFYSEIDPTLHASVTTGKYQGLITIPGTVVGTAPVMTSTYNYKPRYFLVNGDAYPGASNAVTAGGAGTTTLIRFLNAGLRTHVPTLLNGDFELLAEDAWPYLYARRQVQLSLLAGKTMDVLWTPTYAGTYPIFDRAPHLTTDGDGPGGMIATLAVGGTITANDDTYGARNDKTLVVGAPGVMGNESAITTATLVTDVGQGTLVFNSDGSFTYTASSPLIG